ncbi:type IV pilus biogenesis/stability protein PilW [Ramlibacter tataouinensis]|uniref:type IV pilus biogenesis/stability protein PilW n=1 Tax=Ramlibacter tataouinensis TaxID=94132 RepID=UPI0022F38828|nr:type IV pilus biogenesis/stability protein PilW [Ramlibacter tataouinensis]WBY01867.1 type IV pilus biogenesis/stability protein PilW [Ramlibacter tataouinensis]
MKRGVGLVGLLAAMVPWAGVVSAGLLLGGCAQTADGSGAAGDFATASDESEARRRARIRMELAVGYFEQGKTAVALDELKQVIAIDPTFSDAYNLRGLIHMRLNDAGQAEESFRRAVSLNPRDASTIHNLGWLQCQQRRFPEAERAFDQALANPLYPDRAKTLMAKGLCQLQAGKPAEAEQSLAHAYEIDAGNPIIGYNLAALLHKRGDLQRSQFLIRRLNNSQLANAETLWLGVKVERQLGDRLAMSQLADQLKRRFPQSREAAALDRGAFDE